MSKFLLTTCVFHPRYIPEEAPGHICEDCWLLWIRAGGDKETRRDRTNALLNLMERELERAA